MTFQLREMSTATLEEMQNFVVDVEANLLNREEKLKEVNKDKIVKEKLISPEIKLDILTNIVIEMVHNIRRKEEIFVQIPHVSLFTENKSIYVPKKFAAHPWYPKEENDYFMYSIHNKAKDEAQNQMIVEKYPEIMCMFDDLAYVDDFLRHDHHNDDYVVEVEADCKQPSPFSWE
jgi:hypothetical protein